jgi:hypothetical protein
MKKIFLIALLIIAASTVYYFGSKKINDITESDNSSELVDFVRTELKLSSKANITVEKLEQNYAFGKAGEPNGSGFWWASAKIDNTWSYVTAGNGIPYCKDIEIFPVGALGGQFDICTKDTEELINRL